MKKAVITTGGKQYIVTENEVLNIELLDGTAKTVYFEPLLIIDGDNIAVGAPFLAKHKVTAEVVADNTKAEKVTSIRFKAKKRVHKLRGHRQQHATIKIASIG